MRLSDPSLVMLGMSSFVAFAYTIRTIANAVVTHREQDRKIAESKAGLAGDERLARLEAAVESIAIEVERISEGQRFTTRLLTEQKQQPSLSLPRPGKFDTPH